MREAVVVRGQTAAPGKAVRVGSAGIPDDVPVIRVLEPDPDHVFDRDARLG